MNRFNKIFSLAVLTLNIISTLNIYPMESLQEKTSESAFEVAMSKIGIIFDCDGVLVDTEYLKFLSWQQALHEHDITFSVEEYLPLVGYSSICILQKISAQKNIPFDATINDRRRVVYNSLQCKGVPPMAPAIEFVRNLAACKDKFNIALGLASSAARREIMINLQQIGLVDVFDAIISGQDDLAEYNDLDGTNKPKPYIYQKAAQLLGVDPSRCIVFEDTNAGVSAAVSARMTAIAVPNMYTQQHDFSRATRVLDSFSEITSEGIVMLLKNKRK